MQSKSEVNTNKSNEVSKNKILNRMQKQFSNKVWANGLDEMHAVS